MTEVFNALGSSWYVIPAAAATASGVRATTNATRLPVTPKVSDIARLVRSIPPTERVDPVATQALIDRPSPEAIPASYDKCLLIGASTGGVDALIAILQAFPEDCPPTAIVQHTGRGFSESLVQLLARRCRPRVLCAEDGLALRTGMVCIAAGTTGHLTLSGAETALSGLSCSVRPGPAVSGHLPSIDMLFRSARPFAQRVVAAILTGMGQDGASGLLDLRRAGAVTLGQDQASSVVYGMPKAAWDLGAVQRQLPLNQIARELLSSAGPAQPAPLERQLVAR